MKRFEVLLQLALTAACALASPLRVAADSAQQPAGTVTPIGSPALYPETLESDERNGRFLVGSMREGAVYEVDRRGTARKLIDDPRLISVLGIAIDRASNRLLVTSSDLGVSIKRSERGPKRHAAVAIYDLKTKRNLHYVDLAALAPEGEHLINGITVDAQGNAYATDSFSPIIYKVTPDGHATVFVRDAEFQGEGVNLNGIVYHAGGFLLVVKKSTGAVYRIPLADPAHWTRVRVSETFIGGDGLLLSNDKLWLIANKTPARAANSAFVLESQDGWQSASVQRTQALGDAYPTTCAALGGTMYVLSTHLDEWLTASADTRPALVKSGRRAEIRAIGAVDAAAPAASGIRRTLLNRAPAHEPGWETRLYLIEYPPLVAAPLHDHPAIGIGFVIEGEFESAFGDGPTITVKAGQSFVDQVDVPHRLFRNTSPDRTLRMLVAYTIRQSDEAVRSLTASRVQPKP
jgi:sugar lactone lactonase YvrE/quercetin dioxygenase-like cupin family protein